MDIFGFEIKRKKADKPQQLGSPVAPAADDGAAIVNASAMAAHYGLAIDVEGLIKNESELVRRYRQTAEYPDCDTAIEEIVNEAIIADSIESPVEVVLDDVELSDNIKKKITEEFDTVLNLYRFDERGHDMFRQWYIDGKTHYHIILDEKRPKDGILELRYVDPRKIRKVKDIKREKNENGVEIVKQVDEYFIYNDKGITDNTKQGVRLSCDSVIMATSGLVDGVNNMVIGYLQKAIKPVNQLKMMEDALVIYRISRAPERRIFYIDVGNLPKQSAEQYVNDMMNKFRNKVVYDSGTGEIQDNRQHLSMMEDFWMPRREGGKGTEITTLPGGQSLGQIEDIEYFQRKLYQSLNVPLSRLMPNQNFSLGRSSEITREEIKFNKFIERLRKKFSIIFKDALRVQVIAKGIIRPDEWDDIEHQIRFDYQRDNHFAEMKESEILNNRIALLQQVDPYVGRYYSTQWIRKNILMLSDDDIEEIDEQIAEELKQHADQDGNQPPQNPDEYMNQGD